MFASILFEAALSFSVQINIQIIQGRNANQTVIAMLLFNLTELITAMLVVRHYGRFTPRQIGQGALKASRQLSKVMPEIWMLSTSGDATANDLLRRNIDLNSISNRYISARYVYERQNPLPWHSLHPGGLGL